MTSTCHIRQGVCCIVGRLPLASRINPPGKGQRRSPGDKPFHNFAYNPPLPQPLNHRGFPFSFSCTPGCVLIPDIPKEPFHFGELASRTISLPKQGSLWQTSLAHAQQHTCVQVTTDQLMTALTTRAIETMGERIVKQLDATAASVSRDALAKNLYAKLFDWLVAAINRKISAIGMHCFKP